MTAMTDKAQPLLARWPEADLFAALDAEGWFRGMDTADAARETSKVYARLAKVRPPLHETHVCRDCGAEITLPYVRPDSE